MRPARSRTSRTHQETVDRRLAVLAAELAVAPSGVVAAPAPPGVATPAAAALPEAPPAPPAPPPVLPLPGRHAVRRPSTHPVAALRTRVAGRRPVLPRAAERAGEPGVWRLGPDHLAVVAVVVAVGLALTTWWVVRATPREVALPPPAPSAAAPLLPGVVPTGPPPTSAAARGDAPSAVEVADPGVPTVSDEVVVHVAGAVRRPGLVVLPVGSRVADAVEAAGGARRGTDLIALNLARPLVDGEQVLVGAPGGAADAPAPGSGGPGAPGPAPGDLVDLNTADQALLETLPGVGPVTATAILDWRAEHGGFTAVDELLEVDGIGEATLEDLAPLVTV